MKFLKMSFFCLWISLFVSSCVSPTANFTTSVGRNHAPAQYTFTNLSQNAESYDWDFGDGATSAEMAPKHTYAHSGQYYVKLTARKGIKKIKTNGYQH